MSCKFLFFIRVRGPTSCFFFSAALTQFQASACEAASSFQLRRFETAPVRSTVSGFSLPLNLKNVLYFFSFLCSDSRMRHSAWLHTQTCCINTHTWITTAVNCGFCIHLQWTAGFNFNLGLILCCFFSVQSVPGIGDTLCFKMLNDLEKDCLKAARGNFFFKIKTLCFRVIIAFLLVLILDFQSSVVLK